MKPPNHYLSFLWLLTILCLIIEKTSSFKQDDGCPPQFQGRCFCGEVIYGDERKYVTNCTQAGFTSVSMLQYMPELTEVLIFTGNNVPELPKNIFGIESDFDRLEIIDMSDNNIQSIKGQTFHKVNSVKRLILNHNDVHITAEEHHPRIFSNFENLEELHLTNAFTEKEAANWYLINLEIIFHESQLKKLRKLHLEQNEICRVNNPSIFCQLPNLLELHLDDNSIDTFDWNLSCLSKLRYIGLENNKIKYLTNATISMFEALPNKRDLMIDFLRNPFDCDCNMLDLLQWFKTSLIQFRYIERYTCSDGYPTSNSQRKVESLTTLQCLEPPVPHTQTATIITALVCTFLILGVIIFINLKRQQHSPTMSQQNKACLRWDFFSDKMHYSTIGKEIDPEMDV